MNNASRDVHHFIWRTNQEYYLRNILENDLVNMVERAQQLRSASYYNGVFIGISYSEIILERLTHVHSLLWRSQVFYTGHFRSDSVSLVHDEIHYLSTDFPFYDILL